MAETQAEVKLLSIKGKEKIKVLKFIGSLTAKSSGEIHNKVTNIIEKDKMVNLIADCTELDYLNSSSIEGFIQYHFKCESAGGGFKIFGLKDNIKNIFELVGVNNVLQIFDNINNALNSFEN